MMNVDRKADDHYNKNSYIPLPDSLPGPSGYDPAPRTNERTNKNDADYLNIVPRFRLA